MSDASTEFAQRHPGIQFTVYRWPRPRVLARSGEHMGLAIPSRQPAEQDVQRCYEAALVALDQAMEQGRPMVRVVVEL